MYEEEAFYQILSQEEDSFYVQSEAFDITKYIIEYNLLSYESNDGTSTAIQQGNKGIITPSPNEGYEVDKIIVKDTNDNLIETTPNEDGTYSFELYDDVTIEVLYKEILTNPKTGVSSMIGVIFTLLLISMSGFFVIKNYNKSFEL